jgi:hypothetical protein
MPVVRTSAVDAAAAARRDWRVIDSRHVARPCRRSFAATLMYIGRG